MIYPHQDTKGGFHDFSLLTPAPSLAHGDLRRLDVLCLLGEEADGRVVATFSLILDHERQTIELGRGAVARDRQNTAVPQHFLDFLAVIRRILEPLSDYSVVADVTTLARGATWFALAMGSQPVSLHPSSFVIQPSCVDRWRDKLQARHGDTARALPWRSETSGLGRFATAWHMSPTASGPSNATEFRPHLTRQQQPFFEYTCDVLDARPGEAEQPVSAFPEQVADNAGTATRTIIDPAPRRDPQSMLASAAREGFETVVVQVPCDRENQLIGRRLMAAGAVLSGVFPMPSGYWYASYTMLVGAEHRQQVIENLRVVAEHDAFHPSYHRLLDLVLESLDDQAESSSITRLDVAGSVA